MILTKTSPWGDTVPRVMPAQDRGEIEETYARYAWGIDLADEDMVRSAFSTEGSFDHLWQGKSTGHEAIIQSLHELWYDRQAWWIGRHHMFNHFIMTPTEEGARVKCFFQILQHNVEYKTNFVFGIGTRDDTLVKENGRWVFKTLFVNAWRGIDDIPWKGRLLLKGGTASPPSHPDTERR